MRFLRKKTISVLEKSKENESYSCHINIKKWENQNWTNNNVI